MYPDIEAIQNPLVREVFALVAGDGILRPAPAGRRLASERFTLIDSYDEAWERLGQSWLTPVSSLPGAEAEDEVEELCWSDIVADQAVTASGQVYEAGLRAEEDRLLRPSHGDDFGDFVAAHLPGKYRVLLDAAGGDLVDCVRARLAVGTGNAWMEGIFLAYRCGGFPCGWDDENRRLVVFLPPEEE